MDDADYRAEAKNRNCLVEQEETYDDGKSRADKSDDARNERDAKARRVESVNDQIKQQFHVQYRAWAAGRRFAIASAHGTLLNFALVLTIEEASERCLKRTNGQIK